MKCCIILGDNMKKKMIFNLILCLLVVLCLTGCDSLSLNDDSKDYNISVKKFDGVDVKTYISSGQDQLIVSVTNKSGKIIGSGDISVSYYDENDKKITIYGTDDIRYNMFEDGNEIVYGFELPNENFQKYYIPAKTNVEVTMDEEYQENRSDLLAKWVEKFTYSYSVTNETITLILKNNGSHEDIAPRGVSVVFYKNNKPIYSEKVGFWFKSVDAGQTISQEFDIPTNYIKSTESQDVLIDFDNIKIFRVIDGYS